MSQFNVNFLDHVAIRVKDIHLSSEWYEKVLGLKKYAPPEWGGFPIMMLAGRSGIALFPANVNDPSIPASTKNIKIDHFAFNVSNEDFEKAKKHYKKIGQDFEFQDHHYFHSIYTNDPDGHKVELTTLIVSDKEFY